MKNNILPGNKKIYSLSIIVFIFFVLIGFIKGDVTYHQKVFKTLLIFIFDINLLVIFYFYLRKQKSSDLGKKGKYLLYFTLYFIFILVQYAVTFVSNETSYDRNYYLTNYISLLAFALFFYLYLNDLEDVNKGLIVISIFFLAVIIWSIYDFFNYRTILTIKKAFPDMNIQELLLMKDKSSLIAEALKITSQYVGVKEILGSLRPELSFGNTDYFSGYAIGVLPLAFITPIVFYKRERKFFKNHISIITFIIAIASLIPLFLSQTRAALLGFYVGIMLFFVPIFIIMKFKKLNRAAKVILFFIFIIIFLVCPILVLKYPPQAVSTVFQRLVSTINNFEFFIQDRVNGWTGPIELFKAHPVFGAGLGTVYPSSFKFISKFFFIYSDGNSFKHAHSEYFEVLGEAGIFGMIFFLSLVGFVLFSLLKRAVSGKYNFNYRLLTLGVASGLISMLVHQTFSLSLRMSVTMTAYFFLLGLGIFLISYTKKALITEAKNVKEYLPATFENDLSKKSLKRVLLLLLILLTTGFFLFMPLYTSEINLTNALDRNNKDAEVSLSFFQKSLEAKPDNVYALSEKIDMILYLFISNNDVNSIDPKYLTEVKDTLDKLNSVIYGYQNIWDKYSEYYQIRQSYFSQRFKMTGDDRDLQEYKRCFSLILDNLDRSINMNYLNYENHILKLLILPIFSNKQQHLETVKDCFITKIFVDFAKRNQILKEQISVNFGNENKLETEMVHGKKLYKFTISNKDAEKLSDELYSNLEILKNYSLLKKTVTSECDEILTKLYKK